MKKVFQPPKVAGCWAGHKVFVRDDGDVVLADGSGTTPENTEDGPLIVNVKQPIVLFVSNNELHGMVPVIVERTGGAGKVHTTAATIQAIVEQNNALVVCEDKLTELVQQATEFTNRKPGCGMRS